ncbi:MAG TPA: hypothetical protein VNQ77_15185 [Frankiaceae bacterium]|nr:hypothetical protein [Frankiaceae bacterium]
MDADEIDSLMRTTVTGRAIYGVKLWCRWTEEGYAGPAALEERVLLGRCETPTKRPRSR